MASQPPDRLDQFIRALKTMRSQKDCMQTVAAFGVRRTSPEFWSTSDQIHDIFGHQYPIEAGILDLNRYKDPKSDDKPM